MTSDVVVIGGGVMGLWCAWSALDAGLRVTVLERDRVGAGASGGVIGALAPHMPDRWNEKKQFQLDALTALPGAIARVEEAAGLTAGYGRIGRIQPVKGERGMALVPERVAGAERYWGAQARMEYLPGDAFPGWGVSPGGWLHDTLTARVDPMGLCRALAAAIRARGGDIREGVAVRHIDGKGAVTDGGPVTGSAVILSAGVESFALLAPLVGEVAGRGEKGQALLLDHRAPADVPLTYGDGTYVIPHASGQVAIGATSEREFDDPTSTDAQLDARLATARALVPSLADAPVVARWAGVRPRGNGRDPMLGAVDGAEGLFAATAGFKISFGIAELAARLVIAEITDGRARTPESFRVAAHLGKAD